MDPFTLLALATAAGFVFNKMSGQSGDEERREFTFSKDLVARLKPDNRSEFDISRVEVLPEYRLVRELVRNKFPMTFITGGAGTGKTTLVRWLLKEFSGEALLGAPTAMAAASLGGKTLHSLCQLPPGWILKNNIQLNPKRRELQEAKLLIIDEISMVTANLLDGVSGFLRVNRKVDKPFGGLPVIMVGDMFQLPPVVDESTRSLYRDVYGSPKFYNAKCLQESTYYGIELNRTYRQFDQQFVDLLTRLREGVDIVETVAGLNQACAVTRTPPKGAVYLSPRNREVNHLNRMLMARLPGTTTIYRGQVEGRFPKERFPSPAELELKLGAQVVFTKNDQAGRWTSGAIGTTRRLLDDKIFVELATTGKIVDVGRITWHDYRYGWNKRSKSIERMATGSYSQFPLVPAWGMTIHKAQGKTIEKVHLDLGRGSFETGQTYVALSRCRSLQGLSLARPLTVEDIQVDYESKNFYDNLRSIIQRLPPKQLFAQLQK